MDELAIAKELVDVANHIAATALEKPEFVAELLNSWKTYDMQTFESLVKKRVIKEDKKDKFVFWVGRIPVRAVGRGKGLYDLKWEAS